MAEYRQHPDPNKRSGAGRRPQGKGASSRGSTGSSAARHQNNDSRRATPVVGGAAPGGYQAYQPADARRVSSDYVKHIDSEKKKKGPWGVIFWIALLLFIVSAGALAYIGFGYFSAQNMYKDVAEEVFVPPSDPAATSLADFVVDWDSLRAKNPDTVAWVYIPGTVVNYPVVQTGDNEKYLTTNFLGEESYPSVGSVFLSAENSPDFSNANNILNGHHMRDGSMFATIDTLRDSTEFNAHRTVYVLTPAGNYRLTSFALVIASGSERLAQVHFADDAEFESYIQDKIDRSVVEPDPAILPLADMEKIFTFVTCEYTIDDGRAVMFASVVESTVDQNTQDSGEQQDQGMVDPEDIATVEDAAKENE